MFDKFSKPNYTNPTFFTINTITYFKNPITMERKIYLQKERTTKDGKTERLYFPELGVGFDVNFDLYEVSEVDGEFYARRKNVNDNNGKAMLSRVKRPGSATVFVVRNEFEEDGKKYSKDLIYNGDGASSQYGRLCGRFVVLFGRLDGLISVRKVDVVPILEPEKAFTFSINSGNPWISCQMMNTSGGVLSIHGHNYKFVKGEDGRYVQEEISDRQAAAMRRKANADSDGADWVPVEFCSNK